MTLLEKIIHKMEQQVEKKPRKNSNGYVSASLSFPVPPFTLLTKGRATHHPTNNNNSATVLQGA